MIRVLFFGRVADLMGRRELEISPEISSGVLSIYNLRDRLFSDANIDESVTRRMLMSVNRDMVRDDRMLKSGDEVAFFSPFSGG